MMQQRMQMQGGGGGNNNAGGQRWGGQDDFTIKEYQASLQEFLSHGGGGGVNSNKNSRVLDHQSNSSFTQDAGNLSSEYAMRMQVPTNFDLGGGFGGGSNKRNRRGSLRSVDDMDLALATKKALKSIESTERPSFQSIDDMGMRSTFKSVDTMDLMSLGNSINDILEEDLQNMTPDMREKYARRLSLAMMTGGGNNNSNKINETFVSMPPGGGRGRPKKRNDVAEPTPVASGGSKQYLQVQTKDCDGPSGINRNSQLSINLNLDGADDESRLSFM
jgi:hypothetical protein